MEKQGIKFEPKSLERYVPDMDEKKTQIVTRIGLGVCVHHAQFFDSEGLELCVFEPRI